MCSFVHVGKKKIAGFAGGTGGPISIAPQKIRFLYRNRAFSANFFF